MPGWTHSVGHSAAADPRKRAKGSVAPARETNVAERVKKLSAIIPGGETDVEVNQWSASQPRSVSVSAAPPTDPILQPVACSSHAHPNGRPNHDANTPLKVEVQWVGTVEASHADEKNGREHQPGVHGHPLMYVSRSEEG